MKNVLIFSILLLSLTQLKSQIWEKADGPYAYLSTFKMFSFDNHLYLSSRAGGKSIYKLDDGEWKKLDTGFFASKGVVHSFNQAKNVVFMQADSGIYLSYDYGQNWQSYDTLGGVIRFRNVQIVDQDIFLQYYNNRSLYLLKQGEETLEKVYTDKNKTDSIVADLILYQDNYLYATDITKYTDSAGYSNRLYISRDSGKTWMQSKSMNKRIVNLLSHSNILFAFASDDELYKSIDYGESWTTDTSIRIKGEKVISYKNMIFACSNQILMSIDDGASWKPMNTNVDWNGCKDMIINDNKLYYLTDRDIVYLFKPEELYWERISPITQEVYQGFLINESDTLFSTGAYTVNYSADNGLSWQNYSDSLSYFYTALKNISKEDSILVAVSSWGNAILVSSDYGTSFRYESFGIYRQQPWINSALIMGNRILIFTNFGNYYSSDAGLTWEKYKNDVLDENERINCFFRLSKTNIILYSTAGLYRTYDNGLTWEFEKADNVAISEHTYKDGDRIYSIDVVNYKMYKSTDIGKTWTELDLNLPSDSSYWIQLIPYNNYLILLTMNDIYISRNEGKNWTHQEVNLSSPNNKDLYFTSGIISGEYLILTSYYGNWRAKLSDLGITPTSVETQTERNYLYTFPPYPNPARGEVKVLFYWDINLPMNVEDISIYDLSGKKIDAEHTLSLEKIGNHYGNLVWDCSATPPGIYLINIKHGTEERTVKVMVE